MFGPKTYDGIVGSLAKIANKLLDHADDHQEQINFKAAETVRLDKEIDNHAAEVAKARVTAGKINALIGA